MTRKQKKGQHSRYTKQWLGNGRRSNRKTLKQTGGQKNSQDYSQQGRGEAEEQSAELFASSDKGTGKGDQNDGGGMEEQAAGRRRKEQSGGQKRVGKGQGGAHQGVAPFTTNNRQMEGEGKDPHIGVPIIRSEEQMEKPAEGDSGRKAKPKKATGKRTTERAGEVRRKDGRGEHRWNGGS